MKQLRRDNTGAGPRRCRSPPIVRTVVEGERRSPGSSSWRSSIRELPSLSQAGTGSRTMAPRGWRQRRKALWSGEAIVRNFEARKNPTALQNQVFVRDGGMPRREFTALEINLKRVYCLFSADLTAYSNVFLRCFVSDSAVISPPFTRSSPAFQPPFKQR